MNIPNVVGKVTDKRFNCTLMPYFTKGVRYAPPYTQSLSDSTSTKGMQSSFILYFQLWGALVASSLTYLLLSFSRLPSMALLHVYP